MDFTREPIIETIITPKEGCKLVIRSSKNAGQEEYFVDAVEVVTFGQALFFRSLERPKPFLVPIADYEILEVREARMVLKSVGIDRSIKIGGGREAVSRTVKTLEKEVPAAEAAAGVKSEAPLPAGVESPAEVRVEGGRPGLEKKRDRRRQYRKRRGGQAIEKEEGEVAATAESSVEQPEMEKVLYPIQDEQLEGPQPSTGLFSSLLQPPPTLISETIGRYRENALFKSAFFLTEDEQYKPHDKVQELLEEDEGEEYAPYLQEPVYAEPDLFDQTDAFAEPKVNGVSESEAPPEILSEHETTPPVPEAMPEQAPIEEFIQPPEFIEDVKLPPIPVLEAVEEVKQKEEEQSQMSFEEEKKE